MGSPGDSHGKESAYDVGDSGSIPGSGRSPGGEHGNPPQYSCLENLLDRGAWRAIVHGILQERILEWAAMLPSRGSSQPRGPTRVSCIVSESEVKLLSRVQLFGTPWTVAYQAPLSMGFSRQEYWGGLPCSPPGDLPDSGIKPMSLGRWVLYHECHLGSPYYLR